MYTRIATKARGSEVAKNPPLAPAGFSPGAQSSTGCCRWNPLLLGCAIRTHAHAQASL